MSGAYPNTPPTHDVKIHHYDTSTIGVAWKTEWIPEVIIVELHRPLADATCFLLIARRDEEDRYTNGEGIKLPE